MLDLLAVPLLGAPQAQSAARSPVATARGAGPPRRILLVRPDHIGDLLMATPAIRALRHTHPAAVIDLLTSPWGAPAVLDNPDLDRVRTIEATWFEPGRREGPDPSRLIGAILGLRFGPDRAGRYDAAVDLRGDFRSILLLRASGARIRAGFRNVGLENLLTDSVDLEPRMDHISRNHAVLRCLGAGLIDPRRPVFVVPVRAEEAARRLLAPLPAGRPIVTVHPSTNRPWASYGAARFAETVRLLALRVPVSIVADGRAADREAAEQVVAAARGAGAMALSLAGRTDLAQAAAVIRASSVLLANDSGAAHLAVAVGTQVVAVFGPTDPALFWTWERPDRNVALAGPSTCVRPCFRTNCPGDHGYGRIAPADVASLLERLIDTGRGESPHAV